MDEAEREYLWQQIKSLEKAKRRWKALAISLLAAFGVFIILGMSTLMHNGFRLREEAMLARMQAEAEAQRARAAEMQPNKRPQRIT